MTPDKEQYYKRIAIDYRNSAIMSRCRAAIHLEDKNDVPFWSFVLGYYRPKDSFDFISYTRTPEGEKATGCQTCLMYKKLGCLSDKQLTEFEAKYPKINFEAIKIKYQKLGLTEDNTYRYIRGHNLFDKLISSIIESSYKAQVIYYVKPFSSQEKSTYFGRPLNSDHEYFSQSLHFDYPEMRKIEKDINFIFLT